MIGYIAVAGEDRFSHRFGGQSWKAVDRHEIDGGPTLLLVLDLHDSRIASLGLTEVEELPLASYINNSVWQGEQVYRLIPDTRAIVLESRSVVSAEPLDEEDQLPNPLPERRIRLRAMREEEDPGSVGALAASDTFVGGDAFVRVLGAPVWLQQAVEVSCSCGERMAYVASIGYEVGAGAILNRPFFIGEGALYFFVCRTCLRVAVRSEMT